jgi:hypothetical protein
VNRTEPATYNWGGSTPKYSCASAHTTVHATTNTDSVQTFEALAVGEAANSYTNSTTVTNGTVTSPFSGGVAAATFSVAVESESSAVTASYQWQVEDSTAYAANTLVSDGTAPEDGSTVTIGNKTYTFKTALTTSATANQVLIAGSAANALDNLKHAIDKTGSAGTDYGSNTVEHSQVSGSTLSSTNLLVVADVAGETPNTYVTLTSSSHLRWNEATLVDGGWTAANGTISDCVYTNDTTATLTATPTAGTRGMSGTGQTGKAHRCKVRGAVGSLYTQSNYSAEAVLTIT